MFKSILTPNEKIYRIRKGIGATQQNIAGNGVSRERISQIEGGETLTLKIASIISSNINKYIEQNKIDHFKITAEFLLKTKEEQIDKIVKKYIEELKMFKISKTIMKNFQDKLKDIENFISKNLVKDNRKEDLYKVAAEYFFSIHEFEKSYDYIFKQYELVDKKRYDEVIEIIWKLTKIYHWCEKFDNVIITGKHGEFIAKENKVQGIEKCKCIYFNCALACKKLERYKECNDWLRKILKYCKTSTKEELDIKILEAECYHKYQEYSKSENIYYKILDIAKRNNNTEIIALVYSNLAWINYETNRLKEAVKYIELSLDVREVEYKAEIYPYAFMIYKKLKRENEMEKYLNQSLYALRKIKNKKLLIKVINEAFEYYLDNKLNKKIIELLNTVEHIIIHSNLLGEEILNIYIKASYYFKKTDNDMMEEVLEKEYKIVKILENQ